MSESKAKYARLAKAAHVLNEKVNLLQAELAGVLNILYVLAQQNGGSIVLTAEELSTVPEGAKLRSAFDEAKDEYVFVTVPPEPTLGNLLEGVVIDHDEEIEGAIDINEPARSESVSNEVPSES